MAIAGAGQADLQPPGHFLPPMNFASRTFHRDEKFTEPRVEVNKSGRTLGEMRFEIASSRLGGRRNG